MEVQTLDAEGFLDVEAKDVVVLSQDSEGGWVLHLDVRRRSVLQERRIVVRLSQLSCVLVRVRAVVELSVRCVFVGRCCMWLRKQCSSVGK